MPSGRAVQEVHNPDRAILGKGTSTGLVIGFGSAGTERLGEALDIVADAPFRGHTLFRGHPTLRGHTLFRGTLLPRTAPSEAHAHRSGTPPDPRTTAKPARSE
jgi:hypothetical protein